MGAGKCVLSKRKWVSQLAEIAGENYIFLSNIHLKADDSANVILLH